MSTLPELQHVDGTDDAEGKVHAAQVEATQRRQRSGYVIRWICVGVGIGAIAFTLLLAAAPPTTVYEAYSPLVGHRAPAINGTTLLGQPFTLSAFRGHFVIVDFVSSWCVPCRQEQPQLIRFAQHPFGGAQLVGVAFQDLDSSVLAMQGPWVGLYPLLGDPKGEIALAYGVDNPPTKFVIDPRGKIVAKILGPVTAAGLDSLLRRASNQRL